MQDIQTLNIKEISLDHWKNITSQGPYTFFRLSDFKIHFFPVQKGVYPISRYVSMLETSELYNIDQHIFLYYLRDLEQIDTRYEIMLP